MNSSTSKDKMKLIKKLNLGCGYNHLPDYLNVDKEESCNPDLVVDIESFPWPWVDNTFTEVMAFHTLEHVGANSETFITIMKELWRVCQSDAVIRIAVPHPRSDNFIYDPTHVRIITPVGIAMFDQKRNLENLKNKGQETKLGLITGIDFEVREVHYDLEEPWHSALQNGTISTEQLERDLFHMNNVCQQIRMVVRVVKPTRSTQL